MERLIGLIQNQYIRFRRDTKTGESWLVVGLWWDDNHAIFINIPFPYIQRSQI
jgi:hypothetical protein